MKHSVTITAHASCAHVCLLPCQLEQHRVIEELRDGDVLAHALQTQAAASVRVHSKGGSIHTHSARDMHVDARIMSVGIRNRSSATA